MAPDEQLRRGVLSVQTPWPFPVLAADGLGPVLQVEHERQAAERGVKDEASWQTYAKFFQISHGERVLRDRYLKQQRVRGLTTKLTFTLGEMLGLGGERVDKLRKVLRTLQAGNRKSLRGWR